MQWFAKYTVIWHIFQNSAIHISRNHNDEIAKSSLIHVSWIVLTIRHNYSASDFLHSNRNSYLKYKQFHWKLSVQNLINQLMKYLLFLHIFVYSLCRFSNTGFIMTSQNHARFIADCFVNYLADFGFVMYHHELIHVLIGFKHDAPCIVRSEARRGHSDTPVH